MHPTSVFLFIAQSPGTVEEILDRENKRMADSLASKVTRLKSVSGGPPFTSNWCPGMWIRRRVEAQKGFR